MMPIEALMTCESTVIDPAKLDRIVAVAYGDTTENATALRILADLAKEKTSVELLLSALTTGHASETTIAYCFITLKQIFSRNRGICGEFVEQAQELFMCLASSLVRLKPATISIAARFFSLVFRNEPKVGVRILRGMMQHDSNFAVVLMFALCLSCESGNSECLEPFVTCCMKPLDIQNAGSDVSALHRVAIVLNDVLSQFSGTKFPSVFIDVVEHCGGLEVLFQASAKIETPELLRVVRNMVELPGAPFVNQCRRVSFQLECLKCYVLYVELDGIPVQQLTELALLNMSLRNCPCVRFMGFSDLFQAYINGNQKLGRFMLDGKLLEFGVSAAEHWTMFWSTVFEFQCVIERLEAKSFVTSIVEHVCNDVLGFVRANSESIIKIVELDASSRLLGYAAQIFRHFPIEQIFSMALPTSESGDSYFACSVRILSQLFDDGPYLRDRSLLLPIAMNFLRCVTEIGRHLQSERVLSGLCFVMQNLMKFMFSKGSRIMLEPGIDMESFVVIVEQIIQGLVFKNLVNDIVQTLQFHSFPVAVQKALAESPLYDTLLRCDYFSQFSPDQFNLFYVFMKNVLSIVVCKADSVMCFFENLFSKVELAPQHVIITLKVGFQSNCVNRARLFHVYCEHFDKAISAVAPAHMALFSSLIRAIADSGDSIGEHAPMSPRVMIWYHFVVQNLTNLIKFGGPVGTITKVLQNVLSALLLLSKCKSLNIGVMKLYNDVSFFEVVDSMLSRMETLDISEFSSQAKFVKRLLRFSEQYFECFGNFGLATKLGVLLLNTMSHALMWSNSPDIRLLCVVLVKAMDNDVVLPNDVVLQFLNTASGFFMRRYWEDFAVICYRMLAQIQDACRRLPEDSPFAKIVSMKLDLCEAKQYLKTCSAEHM